MVKENNTNPICGTEAICIIRQLNTTADIDKCLDETIEEEYPHVIKQQFSFVKKCQKNKTDTKGMVQFVPRDSWAEIIVAENAVENYDKDFCFFANVFVPQYTEDFEILLKYLKEALKKIKDAFKKYDGKFAIPSHFGYKYNDKEWEHIVKIIEEVFDDREVIIYDVF